MNGTRVLLMTLSERTSGKGNAYLSGWLDKASVVAFPGEPEKVAVQGGFAEVSEKGLTVLAENAGA